MKKIFERNYQAVVNRGLITEKTENIDFFLKLHEELQETENEIYKIEGCKEAIILSNHLKEEIADCLIVCSNWLIHRGVDLEKILTKIAEKNEKRAKYQK
jgi:NTP pyrophosphatase (non-canonical NTP hydrolase)